MDNIQAVASELKEVQKKLKDIEKTQQMLNKLQQLERDRAERDAKRPHSYEMM